MVLSARPFIVFLSSLSLVLFLVPAVLSCRQSEVSTDIKIDLEEFEELWVEKAEKVAAKKKVHIVGCVCVCVWGAVGGGARTLPLDGQLEHLL